ncbi:hypothetical protein ABZ646_24220 [Streptomyces sp. NPDC007162]|uniref:hypothetical protein n=1 Tax=Streptomyces sp. NPDC007162 TaxID=3156917 RepID=UPI0033F4C9A1
MPSAPRRTCNRMADAGQLTKDPGGRYYLDTDTRTDADASGDASRPEVIHRPYHGCIDGHEEAANAKITRALEEDGDAA